MKDKIIKETAEQFRRENGNHKIDDNDLLIYIMTKLDTLPCIDHIEKISEVVTTVKQWKWIATALFSVIISLIFFLHN